MGGKTALMAIAAGVMLLRGSYVSVPDQRSPGLERRSALQDQSIALPVRHFLATHGYSFERMAARTGAFYALIARRSEEGPLPHTKLLEYADRSRHEFLWDGTAYYLDGQLYATAEELDTLGTYYVPEDEIKDGFGRVRELLLLEAEDDSAALLHEPLLVWHEVPSIAEWLAFDDTDVNTFLLTFNNNVEGMVFTSLFHLDNGHLSQIYEDEGRSCWPAELQDIDNDGRLELVTYVEDVLDGDCSRECHYELNEQFGVIGAWVQIREWSGTSWVVSEEPYRSFYLELAAGYERAAASVAQRPETFDCRYLDLPTHLLEWADRARSLGAQ